ncbi:MAG TPA: UDP-N-acetylmuramate--L-alanine ligase [Anaerolineaceae bacterium]
MEHVHLIGIAGSGMSAIARLLLESGEYTVSGSDRTISPLAQSLEAAGARLYAGHAASNVQGATIVVRSSAIPDENPEVTAARAAGIPVLKRSDFLGRLMFDRAGIAVAGTHGKTTTTAMLALVFVRLGLDPSYIIGGISKDLGRNAHAGKGTAFIIEADEYDRMFLGLQPSIEIITNLEHDHPDMFPTPADYRQVFVEFVQRMEAGGLLLACADDPAALSLTPEIPAGCRALTYGLDASAVYTARDLTAGPAGAYSFTAIYQPAGGTPENLGSLTLSLPGLHNVQNALAVLAVAHQLGLSRKETLRALSEFSGTGRRFDLLGEAAGITILDDYAHHPTQIRITLAAARATYPGRRIWAVWQPHTYTRTQTLLAEYAAAFGDADRVIVSEVYAAREKNPGFSARQVVDRMSHAAAEFIAALNDITARLLDELQPGDVVLVLSAGDADQVSRQVLDGLKEKER